MNEPDEKKPGCLLAQLKAADAARFYVDVNKLVPENEVDLEAGGYERETHVSVLFGFDHGFKPKDIKDFLAEQNPFYLTLGPIGVFRKVKKGYSKQEDDDGSGVLKVDVVSKPLVDLHYAIRKEFKDSVHVTFPDYKPHLTLAYLKSGATAFDLEGSTKFAGETYYFNELVFSYGTSAMRSVTICPLGRVSESVRRVLNPVLVPKG